SISMGTSLTIAPCSGLRKTPWVTGAGGSNQVESYVGIWRQLFHLHLEALCVFSIRKARAMDVRAANYLHTRDHNVHLRPLWKLRVLLKANLAVLNHPF